MKFRITIIKVKKFIACDHLLLDNNASLLFIINVI